MVSGTLSSGSCPDMSLQAEYRNAGSGRGVAAPAPLRVESASGWPPPAEAANRRRWEPSRSAHAA